jgi:hypothetical protein
LKNTFQSELEDAIKLALENIPQQDKAGIYAISFFVNDEEDDPRKPTLTVGYNTEANWKASTGQASSSDEAKWNFAFWLQNVLLFSGDGKLAEKTNEWVKETGLTYTNSEQDTDFDRYMEFGAEITRRFVSVLCEISSQLHKSNFLTAVFGRSIPIIIHELEYYDEIAEQTERANPNGLVKEFVDWVKKGCN